MERAVIKSADHPRIRGEHDPSTGMSLQQMGSSPHTRGAPEDTTKFSSMERIIPAYAGSTFARGATRPSTRDHPRIRGEHASVTDTGTLAAGSSPHTRGARLSHPPTSPTGRIIPAYAGSTAARIICFLAPWDHPRIRGEHE